MAFNALSSPPREMSTMSRSRVSPTKQRFSIDLLPRANTRRGCRGAVGRRRLGHHAAFSVRPAPRRSERLIGLFALRAGGADEFLTCTVLNLSKGARDDRTRQVFRDIQSVGRTGKAP